MLGFLFKSIYPILLIDKYRYTFYVFIVILLTASIFISNIYIDSTKAVIDNMMKLFVHSFIYNNGLYRIFQ